MKHFIKKQSKKQQSGAVTKLELAKSERGEREKTVKIEFYGILRNSEDKEIVIDATAKYRTQAQDMIHAEYKNMVAQGKVSGDYKLKEIRVYL